MKIDKAMPSRSIRGRKKGSTVTSHSKGIIGKDTRRKHGVVAEQLGIAILRGEHTPGCVLPGEVEASENLGISRSAYREAIRILAAKGMVESRPKAGTRVTQRRNWHLLDPDILSWIFQSEPTEDFIQGIFELRRIVEPHAAALAAQRRSSEQLARMGHALEQMAKHKLATIQGRLADQLFHEEILQATGNEPLMTLSATIGAAIHWTTVFKQRRHRLPRDPMPEHRKLYAAIADGDPERAQEAARELIELALQDTRRSLSAVQEARMAS